MFSNSIWWLRIMAIVEGISWILLLLVGVPLKYIGGNEVMVKIMGPIHGMLFSGFCLLIVFAWSRAGWKTAGPAVKVFLCSLIPFGWFITDSFLKSEAKRVEAE